MDFTARGVHENQRCLQGPDSVFLGASVLAIKGISDHAMLEAMACKDALTMTTDLHLQCVVVVSSPSVSQFAR
jgi:hypothetical protein